jgi:hypothetical protein
MNQAGVFDITDTGCMYLDCKSQYSTGSFCTQDDGAGCEPCRRVWVMEVAGEAVGE